MGKQLQIFAQEPSPQLDRSPLRIKRSGTFVDNMRLPVHRWFRYSAGFAAGWVQSVLREMRLSQDNLVLDPFVGSGTTLLSADATRVRSIGIEAHPFVARICQAKMYWSADSNEFAKRAKLILERAVSSSMDSSQYPELITRCYSASALNQLDRLKLMWNASADGTAASELVWLAITAILRPTSSVGTAQWQYILPNKKKKQTLEPFEAFLSQIRIMEEDMMQAQEEQDFSFAQVLSADARRCDQIENSSVDVVITSPPYANNYDYADATRFEMSFWGEVKSWGDLHDAVRKNLIISSSQHASIERVDLDEVLAREIVAPIRNDLQEVCRRLSAERLLHGGKKHYHTMIPSYFADLGEIWNELRRVCKKTAIAHFVIGDSAPYGVYIPVHDWLGQLALASGFNSYSFTKLRDRNIKWKNRKHRVPLQEGILTVTGEPESD